MKISVIDFKKKEVGQTDLPEDIFGLKPRADILSRMVNWQLAKRRSGTHKVKNRAEINRTSKKMYAQKGTGQARHGSARVPQFRGGGRAFGPVVRSHEHKLNKKFRSLALRHALSAKMADGQLLILENLNIKSNRTRDLVKDLKILGVDNGLIVGTSELPTSFAQAARNIKNIDVLPMQGMNVYDIMRRKKLVIAKDALVGILSRLDNKKPAKLKSTAENIQS